jgi:hypothetical protein
LKHQRDLYDSLVQDALDKSDPTHIDAIAAAKQEMGETMSHILELSVKSGSTADQQRVLVDQLNEIQYDYNGLLASTDKLETLRRIRQSVYAKHGGEMMVLTGLFIVAGLGLLILVAKTR